MSAHSITSRGLAGRKIPQGTLTPIGTLLFSASEPGAWYDPSDMSTLFQDSAGTTPVTAVEQPVGRMLDKSGRGNHATQSTTTKRPVLSRRVNLLTKTEQFEDAAWVKSGLGIGSAPSVTSNATLAPDGTLTADHVTLAIGGSTSSSDWSWLYQNLPRTAGVLEKFTIWFKAATPADVGRVVLLIGVSAAAVTLSADWTRYELPALVTDSLVFSYGVRLRGSETPGAAPVSFHVWGASLTLATDAHLPYQWVNTATDYDADPAKFPAYLRFDGVDDALQTGNIDFTGTDKMTAWAGVTKLSDAVTGTVVELSASKNTNNGVFALFAPLSSGEPDIAWHSKGTSERSAASTSESAPVTRVITGIGDISGDISRLRVNGAVVQTQTADQGTGNFGNYPLYIGARNQSSIYLNGRLYSLIVRGAQTQLSQIEATELYIKQKMRMP